MERGQFTFYRSYYEAVKHLNKSDRAAVLMAICAYALDEEMPVLTGTPAAIFALIKPTLDASRRKAASGKAGGETKQTSSKTEAKPKQTSSKTEAKPKQSAREKEKEKEKEKEYECTPPTPSFGSELQSAVDAWLQYKAERKEEYKPQGLKAMISEIRNNAAEYGEEAVATLIRECMASNWQGIIFDRLKNKKGAKRGGVRKDSEPDDKQYGIYL